MSKNSLHWKSYPPLVLNPLCQHSSFNLSSSLTVQLGFSKEHCQHQGQCQEGGMQSPPMKIEWNMSTQAGMKAHTGQSAQEVHLRLGFKSVQKQKVADIRMGIQAWALGKCLELLEAVQGLLLQHHSRYHFPKSQPFGPNRSNCVSKSVLSIQGREASVCKPNGSLISCRWVKVQAITSDTLNCSFSKFFSEIG